MRDHSGKGKSQNNNRNPTLDEHAEAGGHRPARPGPADQDDITGNARVRGEDPSPDDRRRGETASTDRAAPVER